MEKQIRGMRERIQQMLDLQEQMNSKVDPNWREANDAWYRAIWIECAELMDHVGYKWWKKQEMDIAQVHLEIVDIMHFMLAINLQLSSTFTPSWIAGEFTRPRIKRGNFQFNIDSLAKAQLNYKNELPCFYELSIVMNYANMDFNELFKQYCAKNVLNIFRQDNGYKEGTYQKLWHQNGLPVEDNIVLTKILKGYTGTEINFMGRLKDDLQKAYKENL